MSRLAHAHVPASIFCSISLAVRKAQGRGGGSGNFWFTSLITNTSLGRTGCPSAGVNLLGQLATMSAGSRPHWGFTQLGCMGALTKEHPSVLDHLSSTMDTRLHTAKRHSCAPCYLSKDMQVHYAPSCGHSSAHRETMPESETAVCQTGGTGAGTTQLDFSSSKGMT